MSSILQYRYGIAKTGKAIKQYRFFVNKLTRVGWIDITPKAYTTAFTMSGAARLAKSFITQCIAIDEAEYSHYRGNPR